MFIPFYDNNPKTNINLHYVTISLFISTIVIHLLLELLAPTTVINIQQGLGAIPDEILGDYRRHPSIEYHLSYATLFTSTLLHVGWLHLIGNMAFLWVFADNVEDKMGHIPFLIFYLAGAAFAGCVQSALMENGNSLLLGASGAISAVFGAYVVFFPRMKVLVLILFRVPLPLPTALLAFGWITLQFVQAFYFNSHAVAWWAHISGFAFGILCACIVRFSQRPT